MINGFILMILGMGAVFSFLVLMIVLVNMVAKIVKPFAHMLEPAPAPARRPAAPVSASAADDQQRAAAAVAAVQMHRNRKK